MSYRMEHEFFADAGRLIAAGATLRDLYDAMLTVQDEDMSIVDASPERLRWLAASSFAPPHLLRIRLNELFNGLKVAHSDDYVLAMVGVLGRRGTRDALLHLVRNDDDFREAVFWRIFEVEGGGEVSLANIDKFSSGEENWKDTVLALVADGTVDRARVLRSCLEALNRDFSSYRAGWFSREYATLEPTPQESAADQDLLRLSLGSPVTATVSLAVKHLVAVHKGGMLDAPAFVETCSAALGGAKGTAVAVLRVLSAIAANGEDDPDAVAAAMASGLVNPHADVQRAAVLALQKTGRGDLAEQSRTTLAPAVAAELLSAGMEETPASTALSAVEAPTLPHAEPARPWTDDDAQERFAAVLEDASDPLEFELALAWLAVAENAAEIIAPLERRARKLAEDEEHWAAALILAALDPDADFLPRRFFRGSSTALVDGEWITEYREPEPRPTAEESTVLPSLVTRVREVAAIVQGRIPRRPLLATPEDSQGWVSGARLCARHSAQSQSGAVPLPADVAQALLRVRPEELPGVLAALDADPPRITDAIRIEWRSRESSSRKANGDAEWVWWSPVIHAEPIETASLTDPALIPSTPKELWGSHRSTSALVAGQLALVHPPSTLRLTAVGVGILTSAVEEASEHRAESILSALAIHAGAWTAETIQLVALGMSAVSGDIRARAAELLAAAVPARLSPELAAEGFLACAPACVLTRWAGSFTDAATLAPGAVVDVLTGLLAGLDRRQRGVGALLAVLLDESIRLQQPVSDVALRERLSEYGGSSAAAKAAKALLQLGTSERSSA